jgi:hypothetical protein
MSFEKAICGFKECEELRETVKQLTKEIEHLTMIKEEYNEIIELFKDFQKEKMKTNNIETDGETKV